MSVTDQAFVTLATNDAYCQGALVLGCSLKNQRTARKLVVLVTPQVSELLRAVLAQVFDEVIAVNLLDSEDDIHLAFLKRPELGVTLTKLHCWTLTQYSKCVFLDADTLVLANIDELFDRGEFSAAPDPGWPDCFNSGVFVFQPCMETHRLLLLHAMQHGSFDGADQGLLNSFFSDWSTADIQKHLPFIYNLSSNAVYTYSPAFQQFGSSAKVVHFLGSTKPWHCTYNPQTGCVSEEVLGSSSRQHLSFLNLWWRVFQDGVRPLYEEAGAKQKQLPPGHAGGLDVLNVPCANSALSEQCANSVTSAEVLRPGLLSFASEHTAEVGEAPPSPEGRPSKDTVGSPPMQTVARIAPEPVPLSSIPPANFTETQSLLQPETNVKSDPAEESSDPSLESPIELCRDPGSRETLQVDLVTSVSKISIKEKLREPSPEEDRRKWEEGHIDYMGKDAFARIQEKLDRFLQ